MHPARPAIACSALALAQLGWQPRRLTSDSCGAGARRDWFYSSDSAIDLGWANKCGWYLTSEPNGSPGRGDPGGVPEGILHEGDRVRVRAMPLPDKCRGKCKEAYLFICCPRSREQRGDWGGGGQQGPQAVAKLAEPNDDGRVQLWQG